MNDEEWEQQRMRSIMAAFQTGRPVFGDSEGRLEFADGDHERVGDDVGWTGADVPVAKVRISWWARMKRWFGKGPR